ncbi:hypothetical protein RAM80_07615 [Pseudomonas sp. App30]|uniref:hypothetical protein n=1 Tax=Pseudomonas sp. App30 TaxID=3068990 RepID=UPI003A7FC348
MTDNTELKRLAEASSPYTEVSSEIEVWDQHSGYRLSSESDVEFMNAANPAAILALIAENEQFRVDRANAMDDACLIAGERDQLKAEVEALRAQLSKSPSVGFDWDAETTAMRKDAGRYRWLNSQRSKVWKEIADVPMNETDQFIDAAMSKETGHD